MKENNQSLAFLMGIIVIILFLTILYYIKDI